LTKNLSPKKREDWQPKFLAHLRESANVAESAREAGITRQNAYHFKGIDGPFSEAWDDAIEEGLDYLEAEARRRAFEGTDKPITYQGEIKDTVKEYSDTLMIFLLKGRRREIYGDKVQQELSGRGGAPISIIEVGEAGDGSNDGTKEPGTETWP
jgi:hypothetical protein